MTNDDSDITIGPGKLLGLFFMLVVICGVFFAIGYSLGKSSAREQAMNDKNPLSASLSSAAVGDPNAPKPSAAVPVKNATEGDSEQVQAPAKTSPDLTFYGAVKQTDPGDAGGTQGAAQPSAAKTGTEKRTEQASPKTTAAPALTQTADAGTAAKATPKNEVKTEMSGGSFVVQIAAVTREEDAAALAGALRRKSYSVFVVNNPAVHDKFYHVQVGPFTTLQDAEAVKIKLTSEGYNPIVKRS